MGLGYSRLEKWIKNESNPSFFVMLIKLKDDGNGRLKETDIWKRSDKDKRAIIHTTPDQEWLVSS
jgi:hypothetical protein